MPDDFAYCEQLVREEDRDRFLAALFAPAVLRPALFSIYAFDIEVTHIAERVSEPLAGEVRLQWWHDVITGATREQAAGSPVASALLQTITRHALPERLFVEMIEAHRDALYRKPVETIAQFEDWAAKTEGGIVALAARVLSGGAENLDEVSRHAGIALTCIQVAIPDAEIASYRSLADRHLESVHASMTPVVEANAAFLPLALVRPVLHSLEKDRAPLPQWRRQWILWRASRNLRNYL